MLIGITPPKSMVSIPPSVSEYHISSASSVSTLSSSVTLDLDTTVGLGVDVGKYVREGGGVAIPSVPF